MYFKWKIRLLGEKIDLVCPATVQGISPQIWQKFLGSSFSIWIKFLSNINSLWLAGVVGKCFVIWNHCPSRWWPMADQGFSGQWRKILKSRAKPTFGEIRWTLAGICYMWQSASDRVAATKDNRMPILGTQKTKKATNAAAADDVSAINFHGKCQFLFG